MNIIINCKGKYLWETNNEEQFVEFDEILNFIHENTGFDKEVIEKVLDAETRFLIKSGIATELKE